jgi:hypothetical protein
MKPSMKRPGLLLLFLAAIGLALAGCAGTTSKYTPANAPETFPCVPADRLETIIVPQAALADLSCSYKSWEGSDNLHFNVTVKNISTQPQRYRVNIFMDNGKGVGGLIPRTEKEGLIEPGQEGSFTYPVPGMAAQPKSVTVKIGTVEP